jgi:stage V sporulation protein AA
VIIINNEQVYINLETKYSVGLNTHVYVKDLGEVYCNNENIKKKVEDTRVYNGQDKESYDYISGNEITTKVLDSVENIDLNIIGGPDVLLEIKGKEHFNQLFNVLKIVFVSIILFLGAAMAIIYFYEDVNMKGTLEKMFLIITGEKKKNPLSLNISFSLGIGIGMYAFFSRTFSFSQRRKQEPGPMELELYLYDKDIEDNILHELKQKDKS